jgi:hypothetical protein
VIELDEQEAARRGLVTWPVTARVRQPRIESARGCF